jgi:AcrR family transcriptional regulator
LLEVAGQVFAEKGVDRATSKEICARAGANVAAINYHFGGFDKLYAAVLCEAHRRLASVEMLRDAVVHAAGAGAEAKLRAVIRLIVESLTGPLSATWVVRVLGRELMAPSAALEVLREREIGPKSLVIREIVASLTGLPQDHPTVARGCISVIAPCFMLLLLDRRALKRIFPALAPEDAAGMTEHLVKFALAGLSAVGGAAGANADSC